MRLFAVGLVVVCSWGGWAYGQAPTKAPTAELPDAPQVGSAEKIPRRGDFPAILAPQIARQKLTVGDKFHLYRHQAFGPLTFGRLALTAGFKMAKPPAGYPHEWKTGGGGFGRLYGDALARKEAQKLAQFGVGAAVGEDPRYVPSEGHGLGRVVHALVFVFVDKSDSGRNMPAVSHFAGAAANGFTGMAYLPRGFDDVTHAGQRSIGALVGYTVGNLANEYCPEWGPWMRKAHLPFVRVPCADRVKH